VHPRLAVISVGAGNSYGHPSSDVVRSLLDRGSTVLRTDQLGSIIIRTDGRSLTVIAGGHHWSPVPARR
jgi:competence protein ComEC